VPVEFETNGATLGAPVAPFTFNEAERPRATGTLEIGGDVGFVGEATRSDVAVPLSGTVRGRPPSERPACDGVNCESLLS
jgi:hypothetical protein